jgi:hypothetical protein
MNLIKRITDKLRRKPLLVKPVVSKRNCNTCNNLRSNKYSKYKHDRYICDISDNYIINIETHNCQCYDLRGYVC